MLSDEEKKASERETEEYIRSLEKKVDNLEKIEQEQQKKIDLLKDQKEYVINEYGRTIEEKDKIIDLMAEQLAGLKNEVDILEQGNKDCFIPREYSDIDDCVKKESCKECIIEYFIKKVEEQKNGRN